MSGTESPSMLSSIKEGIDRMWELREQKRALEKQVKALEEEISGVEAALLTRMDAEGTTKASSNRATVSVKELTVPTVHDWDLFWSFIHKHRAYHLLERRPSVAACREVFEQKGKLPGVDLFTKRRINLLTLNGDE